MKKTVLRIEKIMERIKHESMFFTINAKLVFVSIPDFLQRRIFAIA
jgi:hypothetical protein